MQQKKKLEKQQAAASQASLVSLDASSHTGAGNSECKLSIVKVQVKLRKCTKIVQTYAFLDGAKHKWKKGESS